MSHTAKAIQATTADPSQFKALDHLQIAQVDVPEPGEGEVLVAIKLRPVNPTDIAQSQGLYGDGRDGKPFSVG
jgi:NADPH:quinone reductase-like Zn-dependent oxidoreductase